MFFYRKHVAKHKKISHALLKQFCLIKIINFKKTNLHFLILTKAGGTYKQERSGYCFGKPDWIFDYYFNIHSLKDLTVLGFLKYHITLNTLRKKKA